MAYSHFITENIAPQAAAAIGVYNSNGERIGKVKLGALQADYTTQEKLYSFGIVSDVHNCLQSTVASYSTEDMQRAGTWYTNNEDVEFVACCGDLTENGTESEFQIFQTNVANYFTANNIPFYAVAGNHDATSAGLNETIYNTYVGDKNFIHNVTHTDTNGISYTDHFIFLSLTTWSLGSSGTPYSTEDLNWLEEQLDEYRNERCFVFTHLFFPTAAGNLNDIYPSGNWLGGTQLTRLETLRDTYTNAHWFSGHSHWKWYTQEYESTANIVKPSSTSGYTIHIPSLAKPIDSDGTTRVTELADAELGVVDVYADHIDIRGVELIDEQYVPVAQYRLDTTLVDLGASKLNVPSGYTIVTAEDFTVTQGSGHTVTYDSSTYALTVTFTEVSQQFRIWNEEAWGTVADNTSNTAKLYVENVSFDPAIDSTAQQYIGCYVTSSGNYTMTSGDGGIKINSDGGIEFNVSSRYQSTGGGTLPVSITFTNLAFMIEEA